MNMGWYVIIVIDTKAKTILSQNCWHSSTIQKLVFDWYILKDYAPTRLSF